MSAAPHAVDPVAEAISEIIAEGVEIQRVGRLPAGYEEDLDRRFAAIAKDPAALDRAVDAGALSAQQIYRFGRLASVAEAVSQPRPAGLRGFRQLATAASRRSHGATRGLSRRGVTAARRVAGPRLRSLERQAIDQAGRLAEAMATRGQVAADHARRLATSGGSSRRLDRLSPGGRALPAPPALAIDRSGSAMIGASDPDRSTAALADWAVERIGRGPGGRVLHVECADGSLVRRMGALGFDAAGADPAAHTGSETIVRAGALERLATERRSSLGGLVLSGFTDAVSPASARAVAHLAAVQLQPSGIVVIVSAHPPRPEDGDPITSDLAVRRPLHPVTWCHLLARYGFGEITVSDAAGDLPGPAGPSALYAIVGRRV